MAGVSWFPSRECWRVTFYLYLPSGKIRKAKYARRKEEAKALATQVGQLERATRNGYASKQDVDWWVGRGWIKEEEAGIAFSGYDEIVERNKQEEANLKGTDYKAILDAYENYSLRNGKGGEDRINTKSHRNNMSTARIVTGWLEENVPNLMDLTSDQVIARLDELRKEGKTDWTVNHYLTKMRLLIDQAVLLGMIGENPARGLTVSAPKVNDERRILSEEEARHLLECSLNHRKFMSGALPIVVRLGLYAGLRNNEMCWLKWEAIDWEKRIISIKRTVCEETGRVWLPKDHELRRMDVKDNCIDFLLEEKKRFERESILSSFVLPGGDKRRKDFMKRPLSENVAQNSFRKMILAEGMDPSITVYSLRHTYATMALRSGIDIRTLQRRMGHSDIKTTMEYLHFIEPESHPMDRLPY